MRLDPKDLEAIRQIVKEELLDVLKAMTQAFKETKIKFFDGFVDGQKEEQIKSE